METVILIHPNGEKVEKEKKHAERILCIQLRHKTPKNKCWILGDGYILDAVPASSSCKCGVKISKVEIKAAKTPKSK